MIPTPNTTRLGRLTIRWAAMVLLSLVGEPLGASEPKPASVAAPANEYFAIQVVDRQTGRGVPLVELRTTNLIRHSTDSQGIVAFHEPGLMNREVFFFVASHGYEFPKDGFGFRGVRLRTTPGQEAVIKIDRLNIAERLYRVTGQGIYRDSVLTGRPVPLKNPVLNGQVTGQDSVDTCLYRGRLFWFWGDTGRPSYPLGHFAMAGAVSDLPGRGGLDPAVGVNLEYFVDKEGFSRPLCPLKEPGLVWLDGFLSVKDEAGRERMVAKFARLKDLGHILERGLVLFNDATQSFEPLVRCDPNVLPYPDFGHAFAATVGGRPYYYFALPFPLTVRMRVPAHRDDVMDPNRYEVFTALQPGSREKDGPCRWTRFDDLTGKDVGARARVAQALKREKEDVRLYDLESGVAITPHGGSVYFNAHRHKWVALFVRVGADSSFLGEAWYAEADTPVGPWVYARKVATHDKYSFYNPKHHPHFDQDGGRTIFFEGTYSWTFSGSEETATPRYDYNQIMYRLNLDDPRLALPAPVYQVRDGQGGRDYLMRDAVARADKWDMIESVAFYAIEPNRAADGLVPVHVRGSAGPLCLALPPAPVAGILPAIRGRDGDPKRETSRLGTHALDTSENACLVPLYEYRHAGSGRYLYSTDPQLREKDWQRVPESLARVWRTPPGPLLLDGRVKPAPAY